MKRAKILLMSLCLIFLPAISFAKKAHYSSLSSMVEVKNKIQKHFDINKDGYLNRYEFSLFQTEQHFNYPLVKKKKQKPYDFNGDLMLQPFELASYLRDKKSGNLKKNLPGVRGK